jgi:hypothetical protein
LTFGVTAEAAPPRSALSDGSRSAVVQVEPRLELPAVHVAELMTAGRSAVALGGWTGRADAFGVEAPRTRVVRRLPALWRLRLEPGQEPGRLGVQYEILTPDGRPDRLATPGRDDSEVRVALRPIPPLVVSVDDQGTVVEGGVVLELDLDAVRAAGRYGGTLQVTLNQL